MGTDFLKELNSITKTKIEAEKIEKNEVYKAWRKELVSDIKNQIKNQASAGRFETYGSKKRVCGFKYCGDGSDSRYYFVNYEKMFHLSWGGEHKYKVSVTSEFLSQISLIKKDLEKEGLRVLKFSPAFEKDLWSHKMVIANEMIFVSGRGTFTDNYKRLRCVGGPILHIYYEVEY